MIFMISKVLIHSLAHSAAKHTLLQVLPTLPCTAVHPILIEHFVKNYKIKKSIYNNLNTLNNYLIQIKINYLLLARIRQMHPAFDRAMQDHNYSH